LEIKCKYYINLTFRIGHRQWKFIYKQQYRAPEEKELSLIKKLALEYKKMNILAVREKYGEY
jgi:hypothetical protein